MSFQLTVLSKWKICLIILASLDYCCCRVCMPELLFIFTGDLLHLGRLLLHVNMTFCDWNCPPAEEDRFPAGQSTLRPTDKFLSCVRQKTYGLWSKGEESLGVAPNVNHGIVSITLWLLGDKYLSCMYLVIERFLDTASSSICEGLCWAVRQLWAISGRSCHLFVVLHPWFCVLQWLWSCCHLLSLVGKLIVCMNLILVTVVVIWAMFFNWWILFLTL